MRRFNATSSPKRNSRQKAAPLTPREEALRQRKRDQARAAREALERQFLRILDIVRPSGISSNVPRGLRPGPIPAPEQQYKFAAEEKAGRQWRFDFAWIVHKLAVEIEGGTFVRGGSRHTSSVGHQNDCHKYNRAAVLGWVVLRYTSQDLERRPVQIVEEIREAMVAITLRGASLPALRTGTTP